MKNKNGRDLYFISDRRGSVKIGSSNDVEKRLKELQTGNVSDLYVAAKFEGKGNLESLAHKRLNKYKRKNEWFSFTKQVLGFIVWLIRLTTFPFHLHRRLKQKIESDNLEIQEEDRYQNDSLYNDPL